MATLNPFTSNEIIIEPNRKPPLEIKVDATPIDEETLTVVITKKTYYIIAGAFAEQKNANKMHSKLVNWNYSPDILKAGHLLRVSYNSFNNREDALLALNKIKQDNPEAWILTK